jgi:hypothetical protein
MKKCDIIWDESNEDRILKRYSLNIVTSVLKHHKHSYF